MMTATRTHRLLDAFLIVWSWQSTSLL